MSDPMRIFVGASEAEELAARVLKFTIEEKASRAVDVKFLYQCIRPLPAITRSDARPRTRFSYSRFQIPELCGYKGRAAYLDSDQIVFADIAELFDAPMGADVNVLSACPIGKPHQNSSVMVIDCEKTPWLIDEMIVRINAGAYTYGDIMRLEKIGVKWAPVDHQWNCLDQWTPATKLLHFTDMRRQPWLPSKPSHPHADLWFDAKARMDSAPKSLFPTGVNDPKGNPVQWAE